MDVPLEILDREVALAAAALDRARPALSREPAAASNPLAAHRRVSSRDTYLELGEAKSPLAAPMRAWVAKLTLERVLWPDEARFAAAFRAATIPVEAAGITPFLGSPRDLLLRVLREVDPSRRRFFADTLATGAGPVADAARILVERRREAARLLTVDLDALELPVDPRPALATLAERVLADTAPFVEEGGGPWDAALTRSLGRSFDAGWPARLRARWLFDLFHVGPLVEGLRLDLGPLAESLGASSFVRALGAFGAALAEADGPRTFFVVARAPFDLRRARRSALFAALAADPHFGARALGLGRDRARDQARGVAHAMVLSLRLDAARVLLRGVLAQPGAGVYFEERTAQALGAPIPRGLAGVLPRLGAGDGARLAGVLLAAADRRALVEGFDEDWFKNPHAALAIRDEDASVPTSIGAPPAPAAALEAGLAALVRALGDLG
jgi:hypothetical protein